MKGAKPVILASCDFIPEPIRGRFLKAGVKEEEILLAAEADLSATGEVMPVWFLATPEVVLSVPAEQEAPIQGPYRYEEIADFDLHSTVGSTCLRAHIDGIQVELARFTNEHRERFRRVLNQLKSFLRGEPLNRDMLVAPEADRCQRCGLVLPSPGAPCPRCVKQKTILVRMLSLLGAYKGLAVILLFLVIGGICLDMLPPFLTKILVDDVLTTRNHTNWLFLLVAALAGASLTRALANTLISRVSSKIGTGLTHNVRKLLFDKLQQMSVDYYDRHQVGALLTRVTQDVEALQGFVTQAAQGFLVNILLVVAIGVMLFCLDARLAVYVLIPIPFVIWGTLLFWKKIYPRYFKWRDSYSKLGAMLNGVLSGVRLVKAFGQEPREAKRFDAASVYVRDSRFAVDVRVGAFHPMMAYIFGLGGLIIWYVGGRDVLADRVSLGTLMAYLGYIGMFYTPLSSLALFSNWLTQFMTASQRVFEIIDTPPGILDKPKARPISRIRGNIEFKNVTFGYDPYHEVIKDVSFKIEAGTTVGIVGRSGSGKTTLINLLCRFYDVQKGSITIDGVDIREVRRRDLRRHIGLVLQEPFLFRASIAENIAYGRPEVSMEEIVAAAKAANAHDFIMRLPNGYDTQLGERGAGLSGGERQRISIARAILCDPRILILDEATSSVDTESEREIQRALSLLAKGRTSIIIAHRLSTLREADCILVIEDGRVVEQGTHEELMRLGGLYRRFVDIQTELTVVEALKV